MLPAPGTPEDAALGAVLGAFVGDAAGAVLEFQQDITADQVQHALTFPGGGVHSVGPGQVTDDSELALCLARGLRSAPPPTFPAAAIADQYVSWTEGPPGPFDIGNTTSQALLPGAAAKFTRSADAAEVLRCTVAAAAKLNQASKSNGCLMRVSPLAVWGHRLSTDQLAAAAREDCRLTNPNQSCQDACAAYVIALAALIRKPGDAEGAVDAARDWVKASGCGEVQQWLRESAEAGPGPDCTSQIGFVRWGFVHAFRLLRRQCSYTGAIEAILLRGGDTDTNAAIVGGMIGALYGTRGIPGAWRDAVLGSAASSSSIRRPEWLAPAQLPGLVDELMALGRQGAEQGSSVGAAA